MDLKQTGTSMVIRKQKPRQMARNATSSVAADGFGLTNSLLKPNETTGSRLIPLQYPVLHYIMTAIKTTFEAVTKNVLRGLSIIEAEEPSESSLDYRLLQVPMFKKSSLEADHSDSHDHDDDSSDTATLATELDYYSESESSSVSSESSVSRRSVHFNLAATINYDNTIMCREDLPALWHTAYGYKDLKRETYSLAKQMAGIEQRNRAPHSYQRTLTRSYHVCVDQPVMVANDDDCNTTTSSSSKSLLCDADIKHMVHWAATAPCRLGLDKWALPELQRERSARKHALKRAVLDLQAQQQQSKHAMDSNICMDERLRQTSEPLSRAGRLFAREMALSLAAAEASQA